MKKRKKDIIRIKKLRFEFKTVYMQNNIDYNWCQMDDFYYKSWIMFKDIQENSI